MSEPKTKPTDASVEEFLDQVENQTRKQDGKTLLKMMKEITKEEPTMWGPSIIGFGSYNYKYASGREGIWPKEIPRSDALDLEYMAKQFDMAGGNIRNIALAAAFYAADDGHCVDMDHLMRATLREYRKMGKIVMDRELSAAARK